jgi:hypothetical protein
LRQHDLRSILKAGSNLAAAFSVAFSPREHSIYDAKTQRHRVRSPAFRRRTSCNDSRMNTARRAYVLLRRSSPTAPPQIPRGQNHPRVVRRFPVARHRAQLRNFLLATSQNHLAIHTR